MKFVTFFLALLVIGCASPVVIVNSPVQVIPQPRQLKLAQGNFILSPKTTIIADDPENRKAAGIFNDYLEMYYGYRLETAGSAEKNFIRIGTKRFIQPPEGDAYQLQVTDSSIEISGDTYAGSFYGLQTLMQLLPAGVKAGSHIRIPALAIDDAPRFKYRGMHLDVGRHFFPISFIKKYIDYLARHKMNYFHWHLTEDQGWRIEIERYPELTTTGAWRHGTIVGRYPGTANDNQRYGGYYTKSEISEVVKYAADRHITVIPEIEMPGHSSAAIAAYPWLSCFPEQPTTIPYHPSEKSLQLQAQGKKKMVQETWGVFEDIFCAGNDSTFTFLQHVLDEVIALFPSPYIHIGGDEAPKAHWKKCPKCQQRIRTENLQDEHELQSYFIRRIEKYLNEKGRTIIGWDEILEGGLAPNAVVMSWRGEKGGIEAANDNHPVIMTPQKPVYFDHAQSRNEDSLVWGGYNPLEAVYNYEPLPEALHDSKKQYVLGAQANLWTEYMKYPSKVEYMAFPRMAALAEVLWSQPSRKSWTAFETRLQEQFKRYQMWGAHFSKAYYDVQVRMEPADTGISITTIPRDENGSLRYSINGAKETEIGKSPFQLSQSGELSINYYRDGALLNRTRYNVEINKATGKSVKVSQVPEANYPGQHGSFSLINGIYSDRGLSYPDWLGFIGKDLEAVIDLGKEMKFEKVRLHTLDQKGSWVYLPQYVEVLVSDDGKNFTAAGRSSEFVKDTLTMGWIQVSFPEKRKRYVKVVAKNYGRIPEGQPGGGNMAWVFADEIQVW